jgi:hypothetical protein
MNSVVTPIRIRPTGGLCAARKRRWPLAPGDGFHVVAIVLTVTLATLTWELLSAAA